MKDPGSLGCLLWLAVAAAACGQSRITGGDFADGAAWDAPTADAASGDGGGSGGDGGGSGDDGGGSGGDGGGGSVDADVPNPPAEACTPSIDLYDTSSPTAVIGDGSPTLCVESALRTAAEQGGIITFDCGPNPVTITITQTIVLPVDRDTIIDGENKITLDAGQQTRHFLFNHPDWMNNPNKVVLQRLTFRNGKAPAGEYFPQDPANPNCAYGYKEGSGGVIYMRNGVLHIIDCDFYDNQAALIGPDVGGGAVYVVGVPEIVITGSRFVGNRGANGGAVGMLFAGKPQIYNSVFEDNTAEGQGMNYVEPGCPMFNHDEQGGAGGNSGAVYFDGLNDAGQIYTICGAVFRNNRANELGGALFRTPNSGARELHLDRCLFDGNTGRMGGVSFIKDNAVTVRAATFMHNRSGVNIDGDEIGGPLGGLWINTGTVDIENSTFFDNQPTGLDVDNGGTVTNTTFVDSRPAGSFSVDNSLFVDTDCSDSLSGAHNLQWPNGTACAGGTSFADPQLDTIGDHGGVTPTFLPADDGPVIGVGVDCPATDQRGAPRNTSSCAAGSVEP